MRYTFSLSTIKFCILLLSLSLTACNSLFYAPTNISYSNPEMWGIQYREIIIPGEGGNNQGAWLMLPEQKNSTRNRKTLILHFHGNGENRTSHFLSMIWLAKRGFTILTYDYRGYFDSPGDPDREMIHKDALHVLEYSRKLAEGLGYRLAVYGQSLGGAIALSAAGEWEHRDQISALVAESTFLSYQDVARSQFAKGCYRPLSFLPALVISDELSPKRFLRNLRGVPLLVIHGGKDSIVDSELVSSDN